MEVEEVGFVCQCEASKGFVRLPVVALDDNLCYVSN